MKNFKLYGLYVQKTLISVNIFNLPPHFLYQNSSCQETELSILKSSFFLLQRLNLMSASIHHLQPFHLHIFIYRKNIPRTLKSHKRFETFKETKWKVNISFICYFKVCFLVVSFPQLETWLLSVTGRKRTGKEGKARLFRERQHY